MPFTMPDRAGGMRPVSGLRGHDATAALPVAHEPPRVAPDAQNGLPIERAPRNDGRNARAEGEFRAIDVADSRDHRLIEQQRAEW